VSRDSGRGLRLRVQVAALPDPYALRAAIGDRIAGGPGRGGPEGAVADAVAEAVAGTVDESATRSRRQEDPWH
jgi:hypothetical protein